MDSIRLLIDRISTSLAIVAEKIAIENSAEKPGLNIFLEAVYLQVFNVLYDTNFKSVSSKNKTMKAIDGIDKKKKFMVQITSRVTNETIENTIRATITNKLHLDYDRLVFVFLKKKKKYSPSFRKRIEKLTNGKLVFDFENDIYDHAEFYNKLVQEQDFEKAKKINEILDQKLGFLPESKQIGFNSISVSFHKEELRNVYFLVDKILREGINVFITSQELYKTFVKNQHRFSEYLIHVQEGQNIDFVNKTVLVLSNNHISKMYPKQGQHRCYIFSCAIDNDNKFEVISFDEFINTKLIEDATFKSFRFLDSENLDYKTKNIIGDFISEPDHRSYNIENIKKEVIRVFSNFEFVTNYEELPFTILKFQMFDQTDYLLYFLIFKKDYNLTMAKEIFDSKYRKDIGEKIHILVPKKEDQKTRRRILNVQSTFAGLKVSYIDEFLYDRNFRQVIQEPMLKIDDFVSPVIRDHEGVSQLSDIIHWITDDSTSTVAVIKAAGGVGKTTLCEKIHDKLINEYDRYVVIFIDAKTYIKKFKYRSFLDQTEYDLYNIFKECHPHARIIDKNSFYVNYSLGNIIIIFDGIDEIISTIPLFNITTFLQKLENVTDIIGKGKIIVNCRDTYIEDVRKYYNEESESSLSNVVFYELLSFNKKLAEEYFSKHFDPIKVKTCLKLLLDFKSSDIIDEKKYIFPPFILEIIVLIVNGDFVYHELDTSFNSKLLIKDIDLDFIIYRVCSREINKKKDYGFTLTVDEQVQFMTELAVGEKGTINQNEFIKVLNKIGLKDRPEEVSKGLFDHPFLYKVNGKHQFRFGFLESHFKSVAIFNILRNTGETIFNDKILELFSEELSYDSYSFKSVKEKMGALNGNKKSFINNAKLVLSQIYSFPYFNEKTKLRAISNLTLLYISFGKTKDERRDIIHSLFKEGIALKNICLIDVPDKIDLILDFSNLWFTKSYIENYKNFFACNFSDTTYFDESCYISKVYNPELNYEKLSVSSSNFDKNIKGDNSAYKFIRFIENEGRSTKVFFEDFLRLFEANNKMTHRINKTRIYDLKFEYNVTQKIVKSLIQSSILTKETDFELFLNERLMAKVYKFLKQDLPFAQLNKAQKILEKLIAENSEQID